MLLLPDAQLAERRRLAAAGGPLAPLARSLADDLAPVVARPVWLPPEKARLSRTGGRCPRDGTPLTFDPFTPRRHRCPRCGGTYDDEAHYRWWIMGYHLWLAERAVHAAVLHLVTDAPPLAGFAARVLDAYADVYLAYPNRDNVLGPSRPFFSTYLESLWLLHLCVALDALRTARVPGVRALSARVTERVIEPSRALVTSYDEGASNRQVWNVAASLAASSLLGRRPPRTHDLSALGRRARQALLPDGSWYEGENYHQFAHRGLWYAFGFGARAGWDADPELLRRFALGFAAPLRVALPDLTLPARRDAQYGVTLRQWRWAEWCELGLAWPGVAAEGDEARDEARDEVRATLAGTLAQLYAPASAAAPARDTGRWRATGESERNEPPASLTRASLGWKALLFARAAVPNAQPPAPRSVLLDAQGLAVFRRDAGRLWAALDYGAATGGGHGHPDRLNLLLADGATRWLDDMGTGSYVERALHWYRSTLAHQAPLVDGRSQPRAAGRLLAYDERPPLGWAHAEAEIAPGVRARRALVVAADHVVDLLAWEADREVTVDLPFHLDAEPAGADHRVLGAWQPADPGGAGGLEDGFDFVRGAEAAAVAAGAVTRLRASAGAGSDDAGGHHHTLDGWVTADAPAVWFRAVAPGPPGTGDGRFVWLRVAGARGCVATVWSPRGAVRAVTNDAGGASNVRPRIALVGARGGTVVHCRDGDGWRVERRAPGGAITVERLGGVRASATSVAAADVVADAADDGRPATPPTADVDLVLRPDGTPIVVRLGKGEYRQSEELWTVVGRPRAVVHLAVDGPELRVAVDVRLGRAPHFVLAGTENDMDNERADVNSDGAQLYLRPTGADVTAGWLLVPEPPDGVRVTPLDPLAAATALDARAEVAADRWRLACRVPLVALAPAGRPAVVGLDLVVNEMPAGRERRRGQLVLSGARGEHVYLRGDRHAAGQLVRVLLPV